MTKQELLPCPFCGGEARTHKEEIGDGYNPSIHWTVFCKDLNCGGDYDINDIKTEAEVIMAWNTRQPFNMEEVYKKKLEKLWEQVVLYDSECRAICKHQVCTSCILFSGLDE